MFQSPVAAIRLINDVQLSPFHKLYTLAFKLLCSFSLLAAALDYIGSNFGVDSSNCFSFRAWTHRHTPKVIDATDHDTHDTQLLPTQRCIIRRE